MAIQSPIAKIFSCTQSTDLASKISDVYGTSLVKVNFYHYSDGEYQHSFE